MRNQIMTAVTMLSMAVTPLTTIAQPVVEVRTVDEVKLVENIKATIDTHRLPTKEEVAKNQITENLKKIEEEKRKAEEAKKAAEAAKKQTRVASARVTHVTPKGDFSAIYAAAGARFGVNPSILAAVHYVETGQRGDTTVGSYAGAQGPMQFMPATFRAYGVDGDGDGVANIYDVHDAIFSAANYLAANGAAAGNVVNALLRYNHSMTYVNKVLGIARGFGYNG